MLKEIDHIAIATRDLEAALTTLKKMGDVTVGAYEAIGAPHWVKAVMVKLGGTPIELIQPTDPKSPVAAFIEKRGEGLQHIAYRVDNIDEALQQAQAEGFRVIDAKPRHGYAASRIAFLHPKSTLGLLTELVERKPGKDQAPYEMQG